MRRASAVAISALAAAAMLVPPGAGAQPPLAGTARLQGQFALNGRVTVAVRILGEYVGQTVQRSWTFSPQCPAGPCQTVVLSRQRATGTDSVILHLASTNYYKGSGSFYVPLRCGRRVAHNGEYVPFTVTVQITGTLEQAGVPVATQINATYTNRRRTNRTRCVAHPGHDAAVYQGGLAG